MEIESWEKAKGIFEQALAVAPAERARFLATACAGDEAVRREVAELLGSLDEADSFLESPAVKEMAEVVVGAKETLPGGQRLGPYEIVQPLGAGGMGEVYLAEDTRLHRRVALKLLPASATANKEAKQRLLREARAAAQLEHQNICAIYEIAEADGRSFIAMQFIQGETLADKLKREKLPALTALALTLQIADALAEAHANHIIHRDIKPANIIITPKGQAKVLDFGLAKSIAGKAPPDPEAETAELLSAPGLIMGTVPYMSPEQVKGGALDERTDIFSLGAMFYEMLCGAQPFRRDSQAETLAAVLTHEPPLKETLAHTPRELRRIVSKCLAKDRAERYQTAQDLGVDLRALREDWSGARATGVTSESISADAVTAPVVAQLSREVKAHPADTNAFKVLGKHRRAVIFVLLAALLGGGIFVYLRPKQAAVILPRPALIDSLAVLPFVNDSGNAEAEYLSDGLTESLINSLANLPKLRIISRNTVFSFKGTKQTPQELGKILNVRTLLTGHVTQHGEALTVQAELVDIASNAQIWGRRFDLKMADLLQVPEQIAQQITEKLQLQLNNQQKANIAKQYTDNTEAYREYLKGRFYSLQYSPEGHTKALEHLRRAIEIDPTYALAYAGLADAYTTASDSILPPREALSKAKAAAQKALDLDDKLAEAWAAHGHARLHEWDKTAIDDLNKAIALSPNSLTTQLWLGEYYFIWDVEKSVQVLENAAALDPLSAIAPSFLSFDYYMLRQPQKAIASAKKALDLDPNYYIEHAYLARFYAFAGDFKAATDELNKIPPAATDVFTLSTRGFIFGLQGKRREAEQVIAELQKLAAKQYVPPFEIACVYNSSGNRDQTFFWLNKAFEDRSETVGFIRNLPDFDAIRTDPRYSDLLRRMGLAQ